MSPMSMNTFDARTLQDMARHEQGPSHGPSPHGERAERRFAQLAMAVIGVALLSALLF